MLLKKLSPNKRRICHITTVHPPLDIRIFHKECKSLVKGGYDVTLVVSHDKKECVDGIKIIPLSFSRNRLHRMVFLTWQAFKVSLDVKAYIYHFHDPELIPIGVVLKIIGKKVIYDVHEDYKSKILSKPYMPVFFRKFVSWFFDMIEKKIAKLFFDFIITADDYVKSKFNSDKVYRIANYPLVKTINKAEKNAEKFVCIYVGGLSRERGILKIIESLNYLKELPIEIVLIGNLEQENIKDIITNHPLVKYLGYKSWDEVMHHLSLADIGLNILQPIPYEYAAENTTKIFEYMMVGIPIISSNFPGLRRIIEKNNCGICVNPLDPKEIADAIKYLLEYPEEAKKMGENGRKAVLEKYNWEKESEKLLYVYEKILQS